MTEAPSYRRIEQLAEDYPDFSAAEMHGALSGMLCADLELECERWLQALFVEEAGALTQTERELLTQLYEATRIDLGSSDLAFELLLPDDEEPLAGRTQALGHWCQGFLFGLGHCVGEKNLSDESQEVLRDFAEISRIESAGSSDEDEDAYAEIAEYVRMGVQLIRSEFQTLPRPRLH